MENHFHLLLTQNRFYLFIFHVYNERIRRRQKSESLNSLLDEDISTFYVCRGNY